MGITVDLYRNKNKAVVDAYDRIIVNIFVKKKKNDFDSSATYEDNADDIIDRTQKASAKSFVLCGCDAGAGTTSILVDLAISLAVSGWKTILVDADLRKEGEYKRLNQKTEYGLSDYVIAGVPKTSIIYHTNWSGLDYIACGKTEGETPVKILCSQRMGELLEYLEQEYDFVLYDVPALDAAVDAKIICSQVDCTYLVAASEQTSFHCLEMSKKQLEEMGVQVSGVILNKVSLDEYSRYIKDYDYFNQKEYVSRSSYYNKDAKKKSPIVSLIKRMMGCLMLVCLLSGGIMNDKVAASQTTQVLQSDEDDENTMLPIVVASGYSVEDGVVAAGEKFTLKVHIENVSQYVGAYDVQVTVYSQTEGVHLQQGETNQRYLEYLPPGGGFDFLIDMEAAEYVQSNAANISLQFNYVNESGRSGLNSTSITPTMRKNCDLKVLSLTVVNDATIGAEALFNIRYKNTGEVSIENLKLRIEGNIDKNGQDIWLKAPEIGRQEYLDLQIVFTEVGLQELNIYISYEDEDGNLYEIEPQQVFTLVKRSGYNNIREKTEEQTVTRREKAWKISYIVASVIMLGILLAFLSKHFRIGMVIKNRTDLLKIENERIEQAKRMVHKLTAMVRKVISNAISTIKRKLGKDK